MAALRIDEAYPETKTEILENLRDEAAKKLKAIGRGLGGHNNTTVKSTSPILPKDGQLNNVWVETHLHHQKERFLYLKGNTELPKPDGTTEELAVQSASEIWWLSLDGRDVLRVNDFHTENTDQQIAFMEDALEALDVIEEAQARLTTDAATVGPIAVQAS